MFSPRVIHLILCFGVGGYLGHVLTINHIQFTDRQGRYYQALLGLKENLASLQALEQQHPEQAQAQLSERLDRALSELHGLQQLSAVRTCQSPLPRLLAQVRTYNQNHPQSGSRNQALTWCASTNQPPADKSSPEDHAVP